jgi:GntR family histidine utilization transcriptional repressor
MPDNVYTYYAMPLSNAAPVHQRIRADIEAKILSGAWAPGHRLPYEHELMAQYGCARMTVNKVMSGLVQSGLIERRRRAGSFVRQPAGQSAVLDIPDIKAEILARGQTYGYELLSRRHRHAAGPDLESIAVEPGSDLLVLRCRHVAGGNPFALEDRRIALDAVPEAAAADFAANPPGTWLLGHVPWHEAEHTISACNADPDIATELGLPSGSACLVVDRRTWRSGAPVTSVRLWFPGGLQTFVARFTPAGAAR